MSIIYNTDIIFSPLDQFEQFSLVLNKNFYFLYHWINISFISLFSLFLIIYFFHFSFKKSKIIPNYFQAFILEWWSTLLEMLPEGSFSLNLFGKEFIILNKYSLNRPNLPKRFFKIFYLIFILFWFILFLNLIGMIPYAFTMTAQIIVVFFLSTVFFGYININAFKNIGFFAFFRKFIFNLTSFFAVLMISLIEALSYVFRFLSLPVRLFSNLMSGHALVKLFLTFFWLSILYFNSLFFYYVKIIFFILVLFVFITFEIVMGALQSYVFNYLLTTYNVDAKSTKDNYFNIKKQDRNFYFYFYTKNLKNIIK